MTEFTFHNVSIKTQHLPVENCKSGSFTFHNVSIKTEDEWVVEEAETDLHSTMFLLKLRVLAATSPAWQIYIPQCFY